VDDAQKNLLDDVIGDDRDGENDDDLRRIDSDGCRRIAKAESGEPAMQTVYIGGIA
jgi:hypothetical protein